MNKVDVKSIEGLTRTEAEDLLFDNGYRPAESKKFLKDNGKVLKAGAKGGIFQVVLDYLGEKDRTQQEFAKFVLAETTLNEVRWFSNRDSIRKVLNQVRGNDKFKDIVIDPSDKLELENRVTKAAELAKAKKAE